MIARDRTAGDPHLVAYTAVREGASASAGELRSFSASDFRST